MSLTAAAIQSEIEKALDNLSHPQKDEILPRIRPILLTNLDRGRIEGYIEGELSRVQEYVGIVVENYLSLHRYLYLLQQERATVVWSSLFKKLQNWAYNYLLRKSVQAEYSIQEAAEECATEAAMSILKAHFPYDTGFEPWAHVIVQNACRKYIRKAYQKANILQDNFSDVSEDCERFIDPLELGEDHFQEMQPLLREALAELSETRAQVIELLYFEGYSSLEVAQMLGKSVGAIYTIRFNALSELRKILTRKGIILNE